MWEEREEDETNSEENEKEKGRLNERKIRGPLFIAI